MSIISRLPTDGYQSYELLKKECHFHHSNPRVTLQDGDILYSPNCPLDIDPPPPKPGAYLMDNIFHTKGRSLDPQITRPRWWTPEFGYLSFAPRFPSFSDCPFNVLASMLIDRFSEGYMLRPTVGDRWRRLEVHLDTAVYLLCQRCNITFVKPFSPTAWGYQDYDRRFHQARKRARLSRDWLVIWMGMLSYCIAISNTKHLDIPQESPFSVPDWFTALTEAGMAQVWLSDIAMSTVVDYQGIIRVGLYVDVVESEKNQPSVGWFC